MSATGSAAASKPSFTPPESIIAFAFIGLVIFIGLVGRCFALNHSTLRSAQSLDLMIYKAAPKPLPAPKARRPSMEQQFPSNGHAGDPAAAVNDPIQITRVQRGPKNL